MKNQNPHSKIAEKTILGWGSLCIFLVFLILSAAVVTYAQQPQTNSAQTTSPPAQEISDSAELVTPGKLIKRVAPKYPKQARKQHIEGTVVMRGTITAQGDVIHLQLESGNPLLTDAAMDAVKKWKYRPYLKAGKPVEVETTITVNFALAH
jgi:TonB family protein